MGKKSKKNKKKRSPAARESNLGAEECSVLKDVTIDEVRALPAAPDHVWAVKVYKAGTLEVVDMTNEMFHEAEEARTMLACRCDANDSDSVIQIIFNAMVDPSYEADPDNLFASFYTPRRPRFLLIHPILKAVYPNIKGQVELTGVPVRLGSEVSEAEAFGAVSDPVHERSTYLEGFRKNPTAAIVKDTLPLWKDEIWKVNSYDMDFNELEDSYFLLVIEDVTKQPIRMVGQGPIRVLGVPQAILATMLSPVEGAAGGNGPVVHGVPRRPGLILLEEGMGSSQELVKDCLLGSGVEVMVHNARSNLCGNDGCYRVTAPEELLDCKCQRISYCSEKCQLVHWEKSHKRNCRYWRKEKEDQEVAV